MSDLVVTNDQPKMIYPTIAAEPPGIKVEREKPSRVQILNRMDVTNRASVARVTAGLDEEVKTNTETRGVDDADADQGVAPDGEEDERPELLDRYDDDSSDDKDSDYDGESNSERDGDDDSKDDEGGNNVHEEEFNEDSVGDEVLDVPSPVQRTQRGRNHQTAK